MCHEDIFCLFMSFKAPWDQTWLLFFGCSWKPWDQPPISLHSNMPRLPPADSLSQSPKWGCTDPGNKHNNLRSSQFSSATQLCPTLCNPMDCSTPGLPVHHQLQTLAQTHVHWVGDGSNHLILYHPLLLLPSIFPSIRVFSNESVLCIRWPK